eukprot:Selendium_serpulae@DN6487_c3_g3_i1.p1
MRLFSVPVTLAEMYMACLKINFLIDGHILFEMFDEFLKEVDMKKCGGLTRLRKETAEMETLIAAVDFEALRSVDSQDASKAAWLQYLLIEEEAMTANRANRKLRQELEVQKKIALEKRMAALKVKSVEMGLKEDLARGGKDGPKEDEVDLIHQIEEVTNMTPSERRRKARRRRAPDRGAVAGRFEEESDPPVPVPQTRRAKRKERKRAAARLGDGAADVSRFSDDSDA